MPTCDFESEWLFTSGPVTPKTNSGGNPIPRRYRKCHACNGEGYLPHSPELCTQCAGTGRHYYRGMLSSESQMVPALRGHFERLRYHVLEDPGGGSFFDVVVIKVDPSEPKRGPEVGFVELKLAWAPRTAAQALHRLRTYTGDWAAICHPSRQALERVMRESALGDKAVEAIDSMDKDQTFHPNKKVEGSNNSRKSSSSYPYDVRNLGCLWFHGGQITTLRPWTLRPLPRPDYQGPWPLLWEERSVAYRRLVQMAVVQQRGLDATAFWGHPRGCSRTGLLHDVDYINDKPAPALDDFGPGEPDARNDLESGRARRSVEVEVLAAGQRSLRAYRRRAGQRAQSKD